MDIILIRHGETEDNVDKIFSTKDVELTDRGKGQIEYIKKYIDTLSFDRVYVSPLRRAIQTMELLELDGKTEDRIREIDFGLFEGHTYEEIKNNFPEEAEMWNDDYINYTTPEGESIKIAYARVASFLEELIKEDKNVLLVCHDGVTRIALSWVFNNVNYFFKFKIDNGSANIISIDEMGFKYIKKANYKIL